MAKKDKKWLPSKWDPFMGDLASFKKSLDEMFGSFFSGRTSMTKTPSPWKDKFGLWKPESDMYETEKEVIISVNVPGCDKKNITVDIDNNILTISGERKVAREIRKENFYHQEQQFGTFQRSLSLPHYADTNKAKATCENGILKVVFSKTKSNQEEGKIIDIE